MLGRLTPLENGTVGQEFPKNWKKELSLLDDIGANCIEWLITSEETNPLYDEDLIQAPITAVNVHWLTEAILDIDKLEFVCKKVLKQNISNLVLPLMDVNSLKNETNRKEIIDKLLVIAKKYPNISFSLETELQAAAMVSILARAPNFYVTYDSGNTTSYGYDHREEILLYGDKINNVHVKDRTTHGPSVPPFTGDTDFEEIFETLRKINYEGTYILELFRPEKGLEARYLRDNIGKFKCLI